MSARNPRMAMRCRDLDVWLTVGCGRAADANFKGRLVLTRFSRANFHDQLHFASTLMWREMKFSSACKNVAATPRSVLFSRRKPRKHRKPRKISVTPLRRIGFQLSSSSVERARNSSARVKDAKRKTRDCDHLLAVTLQSNILVVMKGRTRRRLIRSA